MPPPVRRRRRRRRRRAWRRLQNAVPECRVLGFARVQRATAFALARLHFSRVHVCRPGRRPTPRRRIESTGHERQPPGGARRRVRRARRLSPRARPRLGLLPDLHRQARRRCGAGSTRCPPAPACSTPAAARASSSTSSPTGWRSRLDPHYSSERVRAGSLTALPYADASFDRALCLDVLEHLTFEEQPRALAELHRVLTPGGELLVSVPNLAHLQSRVHFLLQRPADPHRLRAEASGRSAGRRYLQLADAGRLRADRAARASSRPCRSSRA